jgi:parallel beta-helix repeat protein
VRGNWILAPIAPVAVAAFVACSSSSGSGSSCPSTSSLCTGKGKCIVVCPSTTESTISGDFAQVGTGDTIVFEPGTYQFNMQLALGMADDVTIVGAGIGQTILDFHAQAQADDAIFAQGPMKNLTIESLTVRNSPGNAFKTLAVNGMTFKSLEVTWAALDHTDGAYGVYPVQDTDVLVENCKISGASDSGIYIGQSQYIVVRNNEAFQNVAGIEIENSFFADVHDNYAHDNTGGILVFDLPNLPQEGGHQIRVFNNRIENNNTENFALTSDIVSLVPAGTGTFVMANHDVEVFGNTISGNKTAGGGIISYKVAQQPFMDANYYQWPKQVYFHDNTWSHNGYQPDLHNQIGALLLTGASAYPNGDVPDVMYDGFVDPAAMPSSAYPNVMDICVHEPGASAVCNGHFDKLDMNNPDLSKVINCDASQFACTIPSIPAVTWPGLPAQ